MKAKAKYNSHIWLYYICICTENQSIGMYKAKLLDIKGDIDSNSIAMVKKSQLSELNNIRKPKNIIIVDLRKTIK